MGWWVTEEVGDESLPLSISKHPSGAYLGVAKSFVISISRGAITLHPVT
jgi:hypothetical protein